MQFLLEAIAAKFAADPALTSAFPGGLWGEAAPEGSVPPYVVQAVVGAPLTSFYGSACLTEAQVRLSVFGIGRDATLAVAQTLATAFKDVTLVLTAGQNLGARRSSDLLPERLGRDASSADDASQGDLYVVHMTFEYAIRTS